VNELFYKIAINYYSKYFKEPVFPIIELSKVILSKLKNKKKINNNLTLSY